MLRRITSKPGLTKFIMSRTWMKPPPSPLLCASPWDPHPNGILSRDFPNGSPEIPKVGTPTILWPHNCRNPTLAKCGGEAQHLEKLEVGSLPGLPTVQSSTARGKTPCIGVFLVSLERSWNVDIENALALAIPTSAAQVMGKRRAGSQTGSLTPDH